VFTVIEYAPRPSRRVLVNLAGRPAGRSGRIPVPPFGRAIRHGQARDVHLVSAGREGSLEQWLSPGTYDLIVAHGDRVGECVGLTVAPPPVRAATRGANDTSGLAPLEVTVATQPAGFLVLRNGRRAHGDVEIASAAGERPPFRVTLSAAPAVISLLPGSYVVRTLDGAFLAARTVVAGRYAIALVD
jgi:hypothetical protein